MVEMSELCYLRKPRMCQSTFSHTHKVGNNSINANFVFPYIFLHYLYLKIIVIVKLDVSWQKKYLSRFQTLLGFFNFERHGQEIVKNSTGYAT